MIKKMPIIKKHVALCKCHKKVLRSDNKDSLDIILSKNFICDICNTPLEYKGKYTMEAEFIVDESFNEPKMEVVKNDRKVVNREKSTKMTREIAIEKKFIFENGMPYKKQEKDPSNGAIIYAIKYAVIDQNINLLNSIFLEYNDLIKTNVARYIGKKEKNYIKQFLNVEI